MKQPLNIADTRQLFVDRGLIDRLENTVLKLHEPVSGGVAIRIDRPWEGAANLGMSVFPYGGGYRMYYRGLSLNSGEMRAVLCVAVSEDGLSWIKPALGRVGQGGRRDANIIADEAGQPLMLSPWLDSRPGVPEAERIKGVTSEPVKNEGENQAVFADQRGPQRLVFWTSTDGFTFRKLDPQPELVSHLRNCFDGDNALFWSEAEQQYLLYYRWYDGYRTVARTTSKDLLHWTDPLPMTYGDTPREQFYLNNTTPYFRAPQLYVALAARFMEGRRVVTDEQVKAIGLQMSPSGDFFGNDCSDAVLLTSRAGSTQYDRTFMEAFIFPGPGASNWISRTNYPLSGLLPCGTERMMFFVNRHYVQDSWHIERLVLRTDGFASVTAPWAGGEMITQPFIFAGNGLEINYRTSAAGSVRIEFQDADGKPIAGYTFDDAQDLIGDEIARIVAWKQGADVSRLAGQTVRLRFAMRDANLYSLSFKKQ
jgi:hypothetical protein